MRRLALTLAVLIFFAVAATFTNAHTDHEPRPLFPRSIFAHELADNGWKKSETHLTGPAALQPVIDALATKFGGDPVRAKNKLRNDYYLMAAYAAPKLYIWVHTEAPGVVVYTDESDVVLLMQVLLGDTAQTTAFVNPSGRVDQLSLLTDQIRSEPRTPGEPVEVVASVDDGLTANGYAATDGGD
jgi:hypothetical protein